MSWKSEELGNQSDAMSITIDEPITSAIPRETRTGAMSRAPSSPALMPGVEDELKAVINRLHRFPEPLIP